ncbi:MAG: ATP-binding protein [Myxococcota bacterium]
MTDRVPFWPELASEAQVSIGRWLAGILRYTDEFIGILDADGGIAYLNRTASGRKPGEVYGQPIWQCFDDEWEPTIRDAVLSAVAGEAQCIVVTQGPQRHQLRLSRLERTDGAKALLLIGTDVTESHRTAKALTVRDEQLHLALEASGMGQWRWRLDTNEVMGDARARAIVDWTEEGPAQLQDVMERIHPDDRPHADAHLERILETGTVLPLEARIVVDGRIRWVLGTGRVLRNDQGSVTDLLGGMLDITEQRARQAQDAQLARLQALGRLAGGIAHDFNNLLMAMRGNFDFIGEAPTDVEAIRESVADGVEAIQRATALTDRLLAFAQRSHVPREDQDLREVVTRTHALLTRVLPPRLELTLHLDPNPVPVHIEAAAIEQVLTNLVLNARDAMPDGGQIGIRVRRTFSGPSDAGRPTAVPPGPFAWIEVVDQGPGIPTDAVDHIFEPFFSTKRDAAGLGLASVHGTVRQHNGFVAFENVLEGPTSGTRFNVFLPLRPDDATPDPAPTAPRQLPQPPTGRPWRVLVAEDRPEVLRVVVRYLERAGFALVQAADGAVALEAHQTAIRAREPFDVAILDVRMPHRDGPEVARLLRQDTPTIGIVLMSGYAPSGKPGMASQLEDLQPFSFLAKPFDETALLVAITSSLTDVG